MGQSDGVDSTQSGIDVSRRAIEEKFHEFGHLIHSSLRALPKDTGDGSYLTKEMPSGLWEDFKAMGFRDGTVVLESLKSKLFSEAVDDKKYIMERLIKLLAELPEKSANRVKLTHGFVEELWNDLPHPPASYLGDYAYRSADGSGNSFTFPEVGAAYTPYARSICSSIMLHGALPESGMVFDTLMARQIFKEHPNKISSMLFYLASIIIHDLFRTSHEDPTVSKTSSYLDLSPLYGSTYREQCGYTDADGNKHPGMRTFKDGKIKPDCFSEKRLLGFPPGVSALLISFNRFHNFVVEELAAINERGRFTSPTEDSGTESGKKKWAKYDEDLFQTGRLVTCGLYSNLILKDYIRTILNINRTNSTFSIDPRDAICKNGMDPRAPRSGGNQVSAEFNLIYRWHCCTSQRDEKWTEVTYAKMMGTGNQNDLSQAEFLAKLSAYERSIPEDPIERNYAGLSRAKDGQLPDQGLAGILIESIEDVAGAFGANNVPVILRAVEILGIEQARSWRLGTLNELRAVFSLKPYETFEDINSDPGVARRLRALYNHSDQVEIYPGVMMEEAKSSWNPGSGLCPGFTTSRAILSDAVALVRGDRFYTVDFNPTNLTNWGYTECGSDANINQGCVAYKLLLRAFPKQFVGNSIYVHYPFTVPTENHSIMTALGRVKDYSWTKPSPIPEKIIVSSYSGAKQVMEHAVDFKVIWDFSRSINIRAKDFMLAGDSTYHLTQRNRMAKALYQLDWYQEVKTFFESAVARHIEDYSTDMGSYKQIDIVRDVINKVNTQFAAEVFSLPLKSKDNPLGVYTEFELYAVLSLIMTSIFFDEVPAKSFSLHKAATALSSPLGKSIELNVKAVHAKMTQPITQLIQYFRDKHTALKSYGEHIVQRLLDTGLSPEDVAYTQIFPVAGAMVANQAQVGSQMIEYYLSDKGKKHTPNIRDLAKMNTKEADDKILHFAMEGIRLACTFGYYRAATRDIMIDDDGQQVSVKAGEKVFVNLVKPARDARYFPDPDEVCLDRPLDSYIHYGMGQHWCLGKDISMLTQTILLKTVCSLENVRRAPGVQGELKKLVKEGGFVAYMTEDWSSEWAFPTTLKIHYDDSLK